MESKKRLNLLAGATFVLATLSVPVATHAQDAAGGSGSSAGGSTTTTTTPSVTTTTGGTGAGDDAIVVKVGDAPVAFDTAKPKMIGGRVMVPVRGVFEKLGGKVVWDPAEKSVSGSRSDGSNRFQMQIDKSEAMVDEKQVSLDSPPRLEAGTTYVPLRFVSEALGAQVRYDNASRAVSIIPAADTATSSTQNAPSESVTPSTTGSEANTANPPGPAGVTPTPPTTPPSENVTQATPAPAPTTEATDTATDSGGFMRYLPWILGALALLGVLGYFLTRKPAGQVIAAGSDTNASDTGTTRKS